MNRTTTVIALFVAASLAGCATPRAVETDQSEVDRLGRIVIPETLYRQANLVEVVDHIVETALVHDPDRQGIKLVLARKETYHLEPAPVLGVQPTKTFKRVVTPEYEVPVVDLHAYNASVMDLIRMICIKTGLRYRVEDGIVTIRK
jgi:bifunctional DNA-binding transcriptional regulator/antitoxin component of YhaV-PrlF toxin-antitoxin module